MSPAEKIAADRALALLYSIASGQRVMATEVVKAGELSASHHRTAERLRQLAAAAPQVWAEADAEAVMAAINAKAASGDGSQITALGAIADAKEADRG